MNQYKRRILKQGKRQDKKRRQFMIQKQTESQKLRRGRRFLLSYGKYFFNSIPIGITIC